MGETPDAGFLVLAAVAAGRDFKTLAPDFDRSVSKATICSDSARKVRGLLTGRSDFVAIPYRDFQAHVGTVAPATPPVIVLDKGHLPAGEERAGARGYRNERRPPPL